MCVNCFIERVNFEPKKFERANTLSMFSMSNIFLVRCPNCRFENFIFLILYRIYVFFCCSALTKFVFFVTKTKEEMKK